MNIGAAITLGIGIAGFVAGILWKVADLSVNFGKLSQRIEQNAERAKEDRVVNAAKFDELDAKTSSHESSIAALTTSVNALTNTCSRIESKLDRLIEKSK